MERVTNDRMTRFGDDDQLVRAMEGSPNTCVAGPHDPTQRWGAEGRIVEFPSRHPKEMPGLGNSRLVLGDSRGWLDRCTLELSKASEQLTETVAQFVQESHI